MLRGGWRRTKQLNDAMDGHIEYAVVEILAPHYVYHYTLHSTVFFFVFRDFDVFLYLVDHTLEVLYYFISSLVLESNNCKNVIRVCL